MHRIYDDRWCTPTTAFVCRHLAHLSMAMTRDIASEAPLSCKSCIQLIGLAKGPESGDCKVVVTDEATVSQRNSKCKSGGGVNAGALQLVRDAQRGDRCPRYSSDLSMTKRL